MKGVVPVSSTLDLETFNAWKKCGLRLNHIIKLGVMAAEQTPGFLSRINDLEQGNEKLQRKLTVLSTRLAELGENNL